MAKEIPLTRGLVALVSDEDYETLSQFKWVAAPKITRGKHYGFYAMRSVGNETRYMHRVILGCPKGVCVDHADGDGLNNTRENLRIATHSQNGANAARRSDSKGYRGVHKHGCKWRAVVGRNEYAGSYDTPEDAAKAYDRAAIAKWGEFARPNFAEAM